jgi:hypothetical protein
MSYILLARPDRLGEIVLALLPIRIGPGFVMTTVHTDGLCALELRFDPGQDSTVLADEHDPPSGQSAGYADRIRGRELVAPFDIECIEPRLELFCLSGE